MFGKYEKDPVIAKYTEALRQNPNNAMAYLKRGMRYNELGELDLGMADHKASIQCMVANDPDIAKYTEAIQRDPNDAVAYLQRAIKYGELGDHDRESNDYKMVIQMAHISMGYEHFHTRDYDSTVAEYSEALQQNPFNAEVYAARGDAYLFKNDFDKTIKDCTEALRLNPSDADAYATRGGAYLMKDDNDRAIMDSTEAIRLNPDHNDALFCRALAYDDKKEYDLAIDDYDKVIQLCPNDFSAYLYRGITYSKKKEYDKAIDDYNKAIQLYPTNIEAYECRGDAYVRKGNKDLAADDYTKAILLTPNEATLFDDTFWLRNKKTLIKKLERLKNSTRRKPNKTVIDLTGKKFNLLTVLERAGNDSAGNALWKCRCDCGRVITARGTILNRGEVKSCGCLRDLRGERRAADLLGKRFGKLVVVEKANGRGKLKLVCKCDCGETYVAYASALADGSAASCKKCKIRTDLTGQKFGRLTVLGPSRRSGSAKSPEWYWKCVCDCGKEKEVTGKSLKKGACQSCGCLKKELLRERMTKKS